MAGLFLPDTGIDNEEPVLAVFLDGLEVHRGAVQHESLALGPGGVDILVEEKLERIGGARTLDEVGHLDDRTDAVGQRAGRLGLGPGIHGRHGHREAALARIRRDRGFHAGEFQDARLRVPYPLALVVLELAAVGPVVGEIFHLHGIHAAGEERHDAVARAVAVRIVDERAVGDREVGIHELQAARELAIDNEFHAALGSGVLETAEREGGTVGNGLGRADQERGTAIVENELPALVALGKLGTALRVEAEVIASPFRVDVEVLLERGISKSLARAHGNNRPHIDLERIAHLKLELRDAGHHLVAVVIEAVFDIRGVEIVHAGDGDVAVFGCGRTHNHVIDRVEALDLRHDNAIFSGIDLPHVGHLGIVGLELCGDGIGRGLGHVDEEIRVRERIRRNDILAIGNDKELHAPAIVDADIGAPRVWGAGVLNAVDGFLRQKPRRHQGRQAKHHETSLHRVHRGPQKTKTTPLRVHLHY